ncbi:hypothetical protein R1flu_004884 [Riccia fluitans]|uniref:Uncharacterized protein n=1 Tax=Riccia fluitans TaxID=41844 RepID=A0ABD1YRX1_9MARC
MKGDRKQDERRVCGWLIGLITSREVHSFATFASARSKGRCRCLSVPVEGTCRCLSDAWSWSDPGEPVCEESPVVYQVRASPAVRMQSSNVCLRALSCSTGKHFHFATSDLPS